MLEVAIGTGLNLPHFAEGTTVVGVNLTPAMLDIARHRAAERGHLVDLRQGDAHELPFDDDSLDSVVCTYSLCEIPDLDRALAEMHRY